MPRFKLLAPVALAAVMVAIASVSWAADGDCDDTERLRALLPRDTTPLKPKILEYKLYARGVGPVLVLGASGGVGREELVRFDRGR